MVTPICVACAADDNYAMPLAVTLRSIADNQSADTWIQVYVLDGGISNRNKVKILKSVSQRKMELVWIPENEIQDQIQQRSLPVREPYSKATYFRFLLPTLLPKEIDRVIYLDCDLIVLSDLKELWDIDLEDKPFAACRDNAIATMKRAKHLAACKLYESARESAYFNAGVLVINLQYWRDKKVPEKAFDLIALEKGKLRFLDQDALNLCEANNWVEIPPIWNQMHLMHQFSSWQDSPYNRHDFEEALDHPHIVHFTTSPKPWIKEYGHPHQADYYHYLDRTAWKGWRNNLARKVLRRLSALAG